jgi:two-component system, cell cycle sensor histidine kinase and response regulator CckA
VITDQTMPEMAGGRLAEELRRIRSDIPIILCTGFSHVMNAEKAKARGIDAFLMKPVDARTLVHTIHLLLT